MHLLFYFRGEGLLQSFQYCLNEMEMKRNDAKEECKNSKEM